jgi:predicted ATPase
MSPDVPCLALIQACRSLLRHLLARPEAELRSWRAGFLAVLESGADLISELVPELGLMLGPQSNVTRTAPQDFPYRFQLALRRFLGVFARPGQPLVLFLDDLQWLDIATTQLLLALLGDSELRHVLLIGAYRDSEIDTGSPLARLLENLRSIGTPTEELVLESLEPQDLGHLMGDALHCAPERVGELTRLVYAKTQGNPLFSVQFLTALEEEGVLRHDPGSNGWQWDAERIATKRSTDNVVQLLLARLAHLSARSQVCVQRLACVGGGVSAEALSRFLGVSESQLEETFREAVLAGLVNRMQATYGFAHDRVQEAAYSLIAEPARLPLHLELGRLLLSLTSPEDLPERIFGIVGHLNRASVLIQSVPERRRLAELNLAACSRSFGRTSPTVGDPLIYARHRCPFQS